MDDEIINYGEWKKAAVRRLREADDYRDESYFWLSSLIGRLAEDLAEASGERLDLGMKTKLSGAFCRQLQAALDRLVKGEPLPLITGFTYFHDVKIRCFPDVLIPRPDSEVLVEEAFREICRLKRKEGVLRIAELCCGSGCLSLALALKLERAGFPAAFEISASDLSPAAVRAAAYNVRANGEERIHVSEADLWAEEIRDGSFVPDLVLANPPYLSHDEFSESGLEDWEPRLALESGDDGLDLIRRIFSELPAYVRPGCPLLLEHGFRQADLIRKEASEGGLWTYERLCFDLASRPRVSVLYRTLPGL